MPDSRTIAYFSMEIGLDPAMPTYAGGLGILAGDTIRAAADLKVPMVAVTLLHRKGYFYQRLDEHGNQFEEPAHWVVEDYLQQLPQRATLTLEGRTVHIRAWQCNCKGVSGYYVPVLFLDSNLPENSDFDCSLTDFLYGGDLRYRLCQEAILGIGGVRMLKATGYSKLARYHMNEGHAALLGLQLLEDHAASAGRNSITLQDVEAVRNLCVFTTHTPVPAGHDRFPLDLVRHVLGDREFAVAWQNVVIHEGLFNMTYMALSLSGYVNGVAKRHREVTQLMFARYTIDSITNGIHAATWASPPFAALFDRYIPDWRQDNFSLRYAHSIAPEEIWAAHREAKKNLVAFVNHESNAGLDLDVLTIGFARRATAYKRADLLFENLDRLRQISDKVGKIQLVFAGKAHPQDQPGKDVIRGIVHRFESLRGQIPAVYLPNYDITLARLITSGVDLWLNTPLPPMEASGTSGMKAAVNGVPSLSVLDGWWIEGHIENVTGWSINGSDPANDAASLYDKLEHVIVPMFYENPAHFRRIMAHCIGLNGSFFNTHRMMEQYVLNAYFR